MLALGVPAGTISYNPAAGGSLTFTGTATQYSALQLSFPADYSTESPDADGLVITGTLTASNIDKADCCPDIGEIRNPKPVGSRGFEIRFTLSSGQGSAGCFWWF